MFACQPITNGQRENRRRYNSVGEQSQCGRTIEIIGGFACEVEDCLCLIILDLIGSGQQSGRHAGWQNEGPLLVLIASLCLLKSNGRDVFSDCSDLDRLVGFVFLGPEISIVGENTTTIIRVWASASDVAQMLKKFAPVDVDVNGLNLEAPRRVTGVQCMVRVILVKELATRTAACEFVLATLILGNEPPLCR